jgi:hypothetical protein
MSYCYFNHSLPITLATIGFELKNMCHQKFDVLTLKLQQFTVSLMDRLKVVDTHHPYPLHKVVFIENTYICSKSCNVNQQKQ